MSTPQPDLPPQPDPPAGQPQPQPNPQPEAQPQPSEPPQPATPQPASPQPVPVPEDQPPDPLTPQSVPEQPVTPPVTPQPVTPPVTPQPVTPPVTPPPVTPQPVQRGQPEPQLPWGESEGSHMTLPDVEPARLVQLREELVERVEEVENDQERKSVVYSIAEEAARLLGLSQYSNRLVVVGTQSSGKSSLLEALLQLPLGFTGEGTATMAAVVYSIRRNAQLTEPRCSIQWQGTRYCDLDLPQLNEKLSAIMTELREIDTQNAVEVTIEDPKVTTITLVDLPGQIAPETLEDSRRLISKEAIRTLIANYLERYPSRNGPLQRILWVKRADFDRAHDPITADLFTDIDPHYTRTMVAATHTDKLSDLRGQALESRLLQSWVDQRIPSIEPWFIALHSIAPERKQRCAWNELRDDIANQLRTKEASCLAFADHLGSSKLHRSHWGWTNFKKQLQGQVNRDFIDNAQLLLSKLLELASRLEREKSVHEEAINPSLAGRTGLSIADEFIDAFRNRLAQLLHYEALDQAFLHKFGRTLADEDAAALHYLLAHNAAPVPRGGGNYHAGVVNADRRAITFVRSHRVNAENLVRINALKPDDFTDDQLLAAIPASLAIDLLNPPESLAALLVSSLKNHLLPFVPYAVWRMAYCMIDSFDPVIELLREQPEYKFIADNAIFVCSLKQAFAEWVEMRARGCEKRLRGSLASFWAYQSWNLPGNLHPRMDQGMMQEVDGSLNHVMTNPNTLHIGGSRILEDVKDLLAEQFEAHKVMFAINIKHTITSEVMSSADPRREPETREERLGVFLKSRLTSPAVCGTKTDPHGICRQSQELADKAKMLGEQAEAIRGLHQELMLQLSSLRNIADDLSVH